MTSWINTGFWEKVARIVLRNRIIILLIVIGATVFLGTQWKHMRFSYTEANLLPDKHPFNIEYKEFLEVFGEEGNLVILAVKDSLLFTPENFKLWNKLSKQLNAFPEVDLVVSVENLQKLVKNNAKQEFELAPFIENEPETEEDINQLKYQLFNKLPFYESLLFNKETQTLRTAV